MVLRLQLPVVTLLLADQVEAPVTIHLLEVELLHQGQRQRTHLVLVEAETHFLQAVHLSKSTKKCINYVSGRIHLVVEQLRAPMFLGIEVAQQ